MRYYYAVIIPCYNEEENITECINRIPDLGKPTQIIVVDDGSSDATSQRVEELKSHFPNLSLLRYTPNRGKGFAVKKGFNFADAEVLIILDADMSVMPEELTKFVRALNSGNARVINGSRFILPMEEGAMNSIRRLGNRIFSLLFWLSTGVKVTDTLCGTKVIYKKDYHNMLWGICPWGDFDILFNAVRLKLKIKEVGIKYCKREKGKSKMTVITTGLKFLKTMLIWNYILLKERLK
jgi:glycosyltransferase involved in cell wall biosynthesis